MRLVLDARTAAFAALIDYAGLFPPASLDMEAAVSAYRRHTTSPQRWIAGRFLCRASQLTQLALVATRSFVPGDRPWEVSVVFDLAPGESAALASDFHTEMEPAMSVAAAEAKPVDATADAVNSLLDAVSSITPDVVPFVEVDRSASLTGQTEIIAHTLKARNMVGGAKLRCGGASAEMFPTTTEVAEFIVATAENRLPFKMTAGLHQPIRHFDVELGVEVHGFVNLLMATALAWSGADTTTVEEAVDEDGNEAFSISVAFASWRSHEFSGPSLRRMRTSGFVAYGSCDFDEPVKELEQLGLVGEGA